MEKYFSPSELDELLNTLGIAIASSQVHNSNIVYHALSAFADRIIEARNKLSHKGLFHNTGNRKSFVDVLINRFGADDVRLYEYNDYTSVSIANQPSLEVYEDKIETYINWEKIHIGLHSKFYDEIIHFLFDEEGGFQRIFRIKVKLSDTFDYYDALSDKLYNVENIQKALSDESTYNDIKRTFLDGMAELTAMGRYYPILTWEDTLRKYGIDTAIVDIEDVRRLTRGKSLDKCTRYQKKFVRAQALLVGALNHKLLSEEESNLITPWAEFISGQTSSEAQSEAKSSYLASVADAFEEAIRSCNFSNTQYMLRKKRKMEADLELCKQIKAEMDCDCFIDRSMHKSSVNHFNIVLKENKVLVFRIGNKTPLLKDCEPMVKLAQLMDTICSRVHKTIALTNYEPRNKSKLNVHAFGIDEDVVSHFTELTSMIKPGLLEISDAYVTLTLPISNKGWSFSVRRKEADECINSISQLLKDYMKAYKKVKDIEVKGIFKERMPHL